MKLAKIIDASVAVPVLMLEFTYQYVADLAMPCRFTRTPGYDTVRIKNGYDFHQNYADTVISFSYPWGKC